MRWWLEYTVTVCKIIAWLPVLYSVGYILSVALLAERVTP